MADFSAHAFLPEDEPPEGQPPGTDANAEEGPQPEPPFKVVTFCWSPLGKMRIEGSRKGLSALTFVTQAEASQNDEQPPKWVGQTILQLSEYFAGKRRSFAIPLDTLGTPFQQSVWKELQQIPFGRTMTYGQLAQRLADHRSTRAVASANARNPVAIIVPCHRVLGADGKLTGYAHGLQRKRWLLEHEIRVSGQLSLGF